MPAKQLNRNLSPGDSLPSSGLFLWQKHRGIIQQLIEAAQVTISVDGGDIQELKGGRGFHLRVNAAAAALADPWTCTLTMSGGGALLAVEPATIESRVPTIGGIRLDNEPPPQMVIGLGGAQYVYARCSLEYITENIGGEDLVVALTLAQGDVTMLVSTQTAEELDDPENGLFHLHIATLGAGGTVQQIYSHSPSIHFTTNTLPVNMAITFV